MYVMLPLTKGYLSSNNRIVWQKGVSLLEGDYCSRLSIQEKLSLIQYVVLILGWSFFGLVFRCGSTMVNLYNMPVGVALSSVCIAYLLRLLQQGGHSFNNLSLHTG